MPNPSKHQVRGRVAGQLGSWQRPSRRKYDFQRKQTSSPLVSGYLYLSPKVFGHLMEAEELVRNCTHTSIEAYQLMEGPARSLRAPRSLRINMSAFLSGLNCLLDDYRRLRRGGPCFTRAQDQATVKETPYRRQNITN